MEEQDLMIKHSEFITSAANRSGFIEDDLQQIVFAGKSNVGKSSLINSLLRRKKLAKTSSTPGKTQLINYFLVNQSFYFVDLPGYGFAKVPLKEKEKWKRMINDYLAKNEKLFAAVSIIDIRHDPGPNDLEMIKWFSFYGIKQILILNKADKLSNNKIAVQLKKIKKIFAKETITEFIPYSTVAHTNRQKVLNLIDSLKNDNINKIETDSI